MIRIKRYQTWTRDGISWSKWFRAFGSLDEKWQLSNKLKNEYKEVTEEEWNEINKKQNNN